MKQPNILFVVIDSLRARNLGCYGYSKPTSPNIDDLAKKGLLFENAFSCAVFTDPSLTSIFSGRYPLSHGILKHGERLSKEDIRRFNESGTLLLPEILKSEGYTTLAVDWLGRWHKRGYDYYSGILRPKKLKLYHLIQRTLRLKKMAIYFAHPKLINDAKDITDKAINLLRRVCNKKFFLFVHYWDTHVPYNPPKRYFEKFATLSYENNQSIEKVRSQFDLDHKRYMDNRIMSGIKKVSEVLSRYDGAIAYVDHQLSRLIKALEEHGILDNTLIVLTSDHGESLTEHGIYFGHHALYDVTIHVPLVIFYPGFPHSQKIKSFTQHVDLVPTLLENLNIKTTSRFDGKSVLPLINNEKTELRTAVFVEEADAERKRAVRMSDYKYICALSEEEALCKACGRIHGAVEELYDLKGDPEETRNVIKDYPNELSRLKNELSSWEMLFKKESKPSSPEEESEKSMYPDEEEVKKRLRELGYI